MKLSQVLLAGAVALVASNAMAYDIAHPFWGPAQGQVASETDYHFTRMDGNNGLNGYMQGVYEKISYGVNNNWTVAVTGAKNWMKEPNNKDNVWALSTTYNLINDGRSFFQVGAGYSQDKWEDNSMDQDESADVMAKIYQFNLKGGVNMGAMTPYAEAVVKNTLNHGSDNDAAYVLRAAVDTNLTKMVSTDIGLSYNRNTSSNHTFVLDAALSCLLTKNVVAKVYGEFLLHDYEAGYDRLQRSNTIGVNLKAAF